MEDEEKDETSNIQNYLASFNREIEDVGDSESENETFYEIVDDKMDQSMDDGFKKHYQQRNKEGKDSKKEIKIIKLEVEPKPGTSSSDTFQENNENSDEILLKHIKQEVTEDDDDDPQTLQMMAKIAEQATTKISHISGSNDLNNMGNSYQTVTIVPSDTNPGELSYVLFVSDVEDMDKNVENLDMSVYDFNNGGRYADTFLSDSIGSDGIKMCAIRIGSRRTQFVAQKHVCSYCNYTSSKRYLLSRHMKSHSDERPHKCGVCERGFKTLASLQNHVNTHTGTRPHMCKECDSCFTTSGELVRHVRYKHTHEKPHKCTECDYASVELSKLKRHIRCHTGERPYQCPHCTYASPDTYKLKRHLRIHTGEKPYECDVCQSRFTQSNSLKAHKLIHSGKKPVFHCEYCPATCGRKTDLRIHMEKLHSCDTPHRCKRCAKVFLDRYSYKLHIKTHDGEKCFKCDLCDYASISQRHLDTHMLIHTDQKPFHCVECGQSFRQKQLLKRHRNLYHNPNYIPPVPKEKTHICSQCSKTFRHKGNLMRHYAVHDPDATVLERESAMRIGEPKAPGEVEDGEEDYAFDENDSNDSKNDQQVVVFEVIQLPSNGDVAGEDTLTMMDGHTVMLNGEEPQCYSIIEPVQDNINDLINMDESDAEDIENFDSFGTNQNTGGGWRKKKHHVTRIKSNSVTSTRRSYMRGNSARRNYNSRRGNTARRGRPPKVFQGPSRLCKLVAQKPLVPDEVPVFHTDSLLEGEKSEQSIDKSLEDCFSFHNEADSNLAISGSFHSDMVEGIC